MFDMKLFVLINYNVYMNVFYLFSWNNNNDIKMICI